EALIQRSIPRIIAVERRQDYVRFEVSTAASDALGTQQRLVLGHAYPDVSTLSDDKLTTLHGDRLAAPHDRWLVCHSIPSSPSPLAEHLGIRLLTIETLFRAGDVYARYCRAYQDAWKADRNASHLGVIVDLDFKEGSDDARHSSILSWLEKSLDEPEAVPTIVCSEV